METNYTVITQAALDARKIEEPAQTQATQATQGPPPVRRKKLTPDDPEFWQSKLVQPDDPSPLDDYQDPGDRRPEIVRKDDAGWQRI